MLALAIRRLRLLSSQSKADNRIKELFGVTHEVDRDTCMHLEKARVGRSKEAAVYSQKVRNYHYYQFFRGQDFIENIPYDSSSKYTLKERLSEEREKERVTIEQVSPMLNHLDRAQLIRERINAYHDKQKKYEIQEFQKYLSQYPGTVRGPKSEDDKEAYREYALKKMPRILLEEIEQMQSQKMELEVARRQGEDDNIHTGPQVRSAGTLLGALSKDRLLLDPTGANKEQEAAFMAEFEGGFEHQQIVDGCRSEVPLIPSLQYENYQHFVNYWSSWLEFRNSYVNHNKAENIKALQEETERLTQSFLEEEEWMDLPSNIPSLYRYYKCLPKEIQDNPGMKDIYLGLEYSSPDFPYEEKEDMINQVCPMLLPLDEISDRVITDYTAVSRVTPSIYLHDKIFTISPEFTWEMNQFLDEIRKQELRGQTTNQDKDAMYPAPPEVHKMWEEGAPNLPVDFYDNEDGFWDQIISDKLKRYDQHKPMLKTRKHFTH